MSQIILQATHGSADHPLRIGDVEIPCYILSDGRRVLVQGGMISALDMSQGTAGRGGGDRLGKFIRTKAIQPFVPGTLTDVITEPIKFRTPNGSIAYGYEATVLAELCDAVIRAKAEGKLNYQQEHIAIRCEILSRGFKLVGIIALVDEATGYQADRARYALAKILEQFINKELARWAKTFPDEFYQQLFRLRGWKSEDVSRRPQIAGRLTNDIVYERLAPGVLDKLREITPKDDKGRRKHKYHQRLTQDVGYPALREHLYAVIALMKASNTWESFYRMIQRALPKYTSLYQMAELWPDEDVEA